MVSIMKNNMDTTSILIVENAKSLNKMVNNELTQLGYSCDSAFSLKNNITRASYIVEKLKEKGAIILGKTNLSEWANYFCLGCPNGYSSMGGQTLNPYVRMKIDTGGSSSGSGVATASNLASV